MTARFMLAITALTAAGNPPIPQEPALFDAWVSFTDKGITSEAQRREALEALAESFDPRAIQRRRLRRTRPGLFDDRDLPLKESYVEEVASTGAEVRVRSRWFNGVSILATRNQLRAVQELPFVSSVSDLHPHVPKGKRGGRIPPDPDLRGPPDPNEPDPYGWAGPQIRQLQLHRLHEAGLRGAGVRIGVIDTGFLTSHPAFRRPGDSLRVVAQWDFMDNDPVASPEEGDSPSQHEHGSVILGILAADRAGTLVGSAPDAEFILLKAEDEATEYFLEERWFAAALEFAEAHGADIVSSSLALYSGYPSEMVDGRSSIMAQAWTLAAENGIIGLQGGGNSGNDSDPSTHHLLVPGAVPEIITVGAVGPNGEIARFSSDGREIHGIAKPELLAWGWGTATISPYEPGKYTTSSGTSTATPLLAGAVACLLQAHPDWTTDRIRTALLESGSYFRRFGGPDPSFVQGYGIPDMALAAGLNNILGSQ